MQLTPLSPRKSLNKAWLKIKPTRSEIENFKKNLICLLDGMDESESEEHNKNDLGDFLKNTFYQPKFYINTKGRNDLVIHTGPDSKSAAGVLIEAKKPSNRSEMVWPNSMNAKAFHELILYYLRERITNHNLEIKHLVATNIFEWYIFDASLFETLFAQNKTLVKQFTDFEEGRLSGNTTDFFYKQIAEPFLTALTSEICFTFFDFREYDKPLRNDDKKDDSKLIALYKLLSPEHLLKLPFTNDSNSLDKAFYSELLHIIGLTETKEGSKKLIGRKKEGERNPGSLIESAMIQLDSLDKISRLEKPSQFGETFQDRLFNVAIELSITWINRILFLKLLEAQLIKYHKGDTSFAFLDSKKVQNFDDLNSLFFSVLARQSADRNEGVKKIFASVPYLNSSLFEPTDLEHSCLFISQLKDGKLPIINSTVLKDNSGNKCKGELNTLEYLFFFLDAYDFAGEGSEEIQEDNKTLINASVLGLIFEKINGYTDGSFFTPGFITMYMCHETIRRAVVQKFNDAKGWSCSGIDQVYDKIEDRDEANSIINSLKICDPAVGSGHFLVSALNEIIAIKSDLKILQDHEGRRLKDYQVEVVNDELIITDEDGELFDYNPTNKESQRIQETLFHEKQTIIENCLFGVDINPNSVKICRLRLWIELLKNAYYKKPDFTELETLPNIDINIKCGNSLISRYALDADLKHILSGGRFSILSYRAAIMTYRNAENKDVKREMEQLMTTIKSAFHLGISRNDPRIKKRDQLMNQLFHKFTGNFLFEPESVYGDEKTKEKGLKEQQRLQEEVEKLNRQIEDATNDKIFENAFEWRYEFPEVLNDEGDFVGFDIVIGNPPYGVKFNQNEKALFKGRYLAIDDIYTIFIEHSIDILKQNGTLSFIIPIFWLTGDKYVSTRKLLLKKAHLEIGITLPYDIFTDAYIDTGIFIFSKDIKPTLSNVFEFEPKVRIDLEALNSLKFNQLGSDEWKNTKDSKMVFNPISRSFSNKLEKFDKTISNITESIRGILANIEDYSETQVDSDYKPIFIGKLGRYYIDNVFQYVKYGENLKEKPSSYKFFEGERLLIRRIVNRQFRIMATIATNPFVNKKDVYIFKPNSPEFTCKYLLAIINSKLISFIKTKGSANAKKDDFTQLTLSDIRQLGIPSPTHQQKTVLEDLVDRILTGKKSDLATDTLVYELYGLTEEEIKVIESSL